MSDLRLQVDSGTGQGGTSCQDGGALTEVLSGKQVDGDLSCGSVIVACAASADERAALLTLSIAALNPGSRPKIANHPAEERGNRPRRLHMLPLQGPKSCRSGWTILFDLE
jgi:hypothetical protein